MSIGNILKPWAFTNNTETVDAAKVNSDFDVAYAGVNDCINALNAAMGTAATLAARLGVSLNADGTIKTTALPVGSYDARTSRTIDEDDTLVAGDSVILVDTTAGDVTLTLLPAATGFPVTIINIGATGYSAIIAPDGLETILGLTEITLSNGGEPMTVTPGTATWWRKA